MMRAHVEGRLDVVLGGVPLDPGAIERVDAWLAVDRPDRLEVLVALDDIDPSRLDPSRDAPSLPAAGTPISVTASNRVPATYPLAAPVTALFEGVVTRHRLEWSSGGGARLRIVALAAYHRFRARARGRVFLHATDSEIAVAIASSLELVAVVDRTRDVHAVRRVSQDPLSFLRRLAREVGYELAVAGQRLYFVAEPPWEETIRLSGLVDVLEANVAAPRGGVGERGGRLTVLGNSACLPMRSVVLTGIDGRADGTYRIARALHHWEPSAYRVTLDVLESGLDLDAWAHDDSLLQRAESTGDPHAP